VDGDSHSGSMTPVGSPTTELNMQLVRSGLTDIQGEQLHLLLALLLRTASAAYSRPHG